MDVVTSLWNNDLIITEKIEKTEKNEVVQPTAKAEILQKDLESEKIALINLIENLEEKFREGEITAVEYTKLYKRYSKELYLINNEIESQK